MNLHCSLDYIQFDANFTLNAATLCMLQYLLFLNLSILLQTFYRVYNSKNGGSIFSGKNMRDYYYLPKLAEYARNTLKRLVSENFERGTLFVVNVDETTDPREQNVLNVIV